MTYITSKRLEIRAALIFGLCYGILITFSKLTSYLFLIRHWICQDDEGTGKARALSYGFTVGHLLGYLLIYYLPFYKALSNFYLKIILALFLMLYQFFWTNHHLDIFLPKSFSTPQRDQTLAFVYGFSYRLLNYTFFPNAIFSRMIIGYLVQSRYKMLFLYTTFFVWVIGHLICIKWVEFLTLWLQKNYSAFLILTHQLYLQDKIKKIRSRTISIAKIFEYKPDPVMKPGIYRESQTIDDMIQILATILFIVALYLLGKSPTPFVPHSPSAPNAVELARMSRLEEEAKVQREIEDRFYPLEDFEEEQKKDEKSADEEKKRAVEEENQEILDLEEEENQEILDLEEEENQEILDMDEEKGFENTLYTFFSDCFFESFSFYAFLFNRLKFYSGYLFNRLKFCYGYLFDLFSYSSRFLNRIEPLFYPFLVVVKPFYLYFFNFFSVYIPHLKFLKWFLFNHNFVFSAIFRGFSHLFFNPRRWVLPYRYIKTSFYEYSVKRGGFSQFGFYKCQSDGKERTSFTYPLSLITFYKMIEGKLSLFIKKKRLPDRDRLYTLWVLRNAKKKASLNKELRKRVQKLKSGSPLRDVLDIRRKLFQFKYTPKVLRSISETLFDQMHPSGGKKRENDPVWDGPSRGAFWYNHKLTKTAAEQRVDEEEHLQTMWLFFKDLRPLNQKEQYLILERQKLERESQEKQKLRRQCFEKSLLGKTLRILKKMAPYFRAPQYIPSNSMSRAFKLYRVSAYLTLDWQETTRILRRVHKLRKRGMIIRVNEERESWIRSHKERYLKLKEIRKKRVQLEKEKRTPKKILLRLDKKTKKGTLKKKQKEAFPLNTILTRILVLNSNFRTSSKRKRDSKDRRNLYSYPNPLLEKINKIRRNRNTVYHIMNTYYEGRSGFTHEDIPKMRKKYKKYRQFQLKLRTIMKEVPRWGYNIDDEKIDYSDYNIRNDDVVAEDVYLRTRKAKFRVFRTKVWKYYERHDKRELKQWYFYRYAKITHFRRNMVKGADRTQRRKVTICGWYEHRVQSPLFLPKRRKTLILIMLTLDVFELMKKCYRFLREDSRFQVRVKRISERINRIWKKLWNLPDSDKSPIEAAIEAENELQGLRESEEDKKKRQEQGDALEEWQERREAHEIRAICIAETWELLQSGHAVRSLILLIQSFLRKNVIFPFLIIAKNMARILLFQSPELFQDFADLKKETHTLCDFGGIPLDESQDPIGWFTDGCQIRIHFPFEWKPWRETEQSKESSVAEDLYLTVFGRITNIPFGTARKPYPFFKTVFEELKKKKASQELKNLLTSGIRKLQKKGFFKFKKKGFLRKRLLAFQKKSFKSKLLKGVKVKKRKNLKKGPQSKLTKKKKERKVDKPRAIINEIERVLKEKKKRLFIIQTSISSTKTSSHSKTSEALRRLSKILKRRKARFIRKSKIFRKLIIEWIYVKILFDLKNRFLDEMNKKKSCLKMVAQFFFQFKKKRKNKMIDKAIKGINKKKRKKNRFISTIKKHSFNMRNSQISNSKKTLVFDLSSLSQAYVFYKLSQTEKSSFRVSKFQNLRNLRVGMNRWKEWLRGHFDYYLLSDIRWSRLEAQKWRNKMNQCRTAENHNFKKGDSYEVDSLPINPQKLKFKKHLRYDLLAYSFLNAEYKKDPYVIAPSLVSNNQTAISHLYNIHKDSLVNMLTSNYKHLRDSKEKHPLLDMHMDVNRTALRRRMNYNQILFHVEDKKKGSKVVDKVAIDSWVTGQNRVLPAGSLTEDRVGFTEGAMVFLESVLKQLRERRRPYPESLDESFRPEWLKWPLEHLIGYIHKICDMHLYFFSVYALYWPEFYDRHRLDKLGWVFRYEKCYDKRRTPILKKQKSMAKRKKDLAARKKKMSGKAQSRKIAQREFDLSLILEPEEVEKIEKKNFFDWMGLNNENELEELMERNNDEKKSSFLESRFFLFPEFIQLYNLLNLYAKAEWTTPIHSFLQNGKIRSRSSYADLKVEFDSFNWYMYDKKEWPAKGRPLWDSNRARRRRRHRRALLNLGRKDPRKETTLDIMIDPTERERAYAETISEMKAEEQKKIDEEYEEKKEKRKKEQEEQGKAFDETSYRKNHKKRFARVSTLKPIKYSRFRKTALKDLKKSNYFRYQVHYSLRYLIADFLTNVTRTSQVTNKATNPKLLIVFIKDLIEMSQFGIMGTTQNQLPTLEDILNMGYLVLNPIRTFKRLRWERVTYQILAISLLHKNQFQKLAYTPGPDNKRDPCLEIGVNKVKQTTYKVRKGRKVVESLSVRRLRVKRWWGLRVSYGKFGCPRSFWTQFVRYLVHPFAIPLKAKARGKKKQSPWSYEKVFGLFHWKPEVRPKKKRKRTPWSYERVFGQFHADQMRLFYKIGVCGKFKRECTAILLSLITDPKRPNDRIKKLILLDEGVPDTLVEKGLLVPENLFSPRRRRQLRIVNELNKKKKKEKRIPKQKLTPYNKLLKETGRMDLNLLLRELDEREKRQREERLNLVQKKEREQEELRKKEEESKELNRIKKKLMRLRFFLWPNYRLEDLACMNRYWFDTTNGSRFSMLRIRVYPRLKTR
uniref:Hypothetical chloroplast RF19 n=1 Tax=Pelargonium endlicherianum TaxID=158596 RepID=A0A1L4BMT7_9ROSI|nr:hypothetical chloroplast RF19 [Pelargonium endlicherianum]YP_009338996.1 hypothetical chloroplast RF19 [Pelargonium endlicherianum]API84941.1 hypothetical chloroplast RF19 [Pelargonium endlicherianum]API84953.1 hypothetical chloroplast RF19 [Pelargonium endlicherianum]